MRSFNNTAVEKCSKEKNSISSKNWRKGDFVAIIVSIFLACVSGYSIVNPPLLILYDRLPPVEDSNSVYVPGTGFLGFWFLAGQLQSIHETDPNHNYYCYSSGCLAVLCALMNSNVDNTMELTFGVQDLWKNGDLSRFEVIEAFVDRLIHPPNNTNNNATTTGLLERDLLDKIHVLTATVGGVGVNVKQPTDEKELIELMIQTTWIPFITGRGWYKKDNDGELHLDGAFSAQLHPPCHKSLHTPPEYINDIRRHVFNVNLNTHQAKTFWEAGQEHGLP